MAGRYGSGFGIYRDATTGGGDITGSGTAPKIPKFTSGTTIGDSQMSDNGTTVFVGAAATSTTALFEINSTTQGFLAPRMDTTARDAIGSPATGLFIYNTDTDQFNYYDGTSWVIIESTGTADNWADVLATGNTSSGNDAIMSDDDILYLGTSLDSLLTYSTGTGNTFFQHTNAAGNLTIGNTGAGGNVTISSNNDVIITSGTGAAESVSMTTAISMGYATPTVYTDTVLSVSGRDSLSTRFATKMGDGSGSVIFQVRNDGRSAFGLGQVPNVSTILRVGETVTAAGGRIGTQSAITLTPSVSALLTGTGSQSSVTITNASFSSGSVATGAQNGIIPIGVSGSANLTPIGTDNVIWKTVGSTFTATNAYASRSTIGVNLFGSGTMTLTNAYNYYVRNGNAGLTATNMYGLYIESLTRGTDNYGIITLTNRSGFGTATPDASAAVDITSTTTGFLSPRMDETERDAIASPATGLWVYNTDTDEFNYYDGVQWVIVESTATLDDWDNVLTAGNTTGANDTIWSKTGTATSTATQVGSQKISFQTSLWDGAAEDVQLWDIESIASTTVNQASRLAFTVNGTEKMAIYSASVGINTGTTTPNAHLTVKGTDVLNATKTFVTEGSTGVTGFQITNSGRAGINVPVGQTPSAMFEVRGGVINTTTLKVTEPLTGTTPIAITVTNNRANGRAIFAQTDLTAGRTGSIAVLAQSRGVGVALMARTIGVPAAAPVMQFRLDANTDGLGAQQGGYFTAFVKNAASTAREAMRQSYDYTSDVDTSEDASWTLGLIDGGTANTEKIFAGKSFTRIVQPLGIGSAVTPVASAALEVVSTTQGFLSPRMTEAERDLIGTPATGLWIYNTDDNEFNYYDGTSWVLISAGTPAAESWETTLGVGNTTGANDAIWSKTGTATGTASQVGSQKASFQMSLWTGAAESVVLWDIQAIASTTVDEESRLAFTVDGVEKGAFYSTSFGVGTGATAPDGKVQFVGDDQLATSNVLRLDNSVAEIIEFQNIGDVYNPLASSAWGIGTLPSTTYKFQINNTTHDFAFRALNNQSTGNTRAVYAQSNISKVGVAQTIGVLSDVTGAGASSTNIALWAAALNGGTANHALIIPNASGNVGVGLTNPTSTALVHIKGANQLSTSDALLIDDSVGINLMVVQNNGRVGINKAAPIAFLSVTGNNTNGQEAFRVDAGSGTGLNGIVVKRNGTQSWTGIGTQTINTTEKLRVNGTALFSQGIGVLGQTPNISIGIVAPLNTSLAAFAGTKVLWHETTDGVHMQSVGTAKINFDILTGAPFAQFDGTQANVNSTNFYGRVTTGGDPINEAEINIISEFFDVTTTSKTAKILHNITAAPAGDSQLDISIAGTDIISLLDTGQVGIGTTTVGSDSIFSVVSTTEGSKPVPSMTAAQASAITATDALQVYVTDTDATFTAVGFWGYVSGAWTQL